MPAKRRRKSARKKASANSSLAQKQIEHPTALRQEVEAAEDEVTQSRIRNAALRRTTRKYSCQFGRSAQAARRNHPRHGDSPTTHRRHFNSSAPPRNNALATHRNATGAKSRGAEGIGGAATSRPAKISCDLACSWPRSAKRSRNFAPSAKPARKKKIASNCYLPKNDFTCSIWRITFGKNMTWTSIC